MGLNGRGPVGRVGMQRVQEVVLDSVGRVGGLTRPKVSIALAGWVALRLSSPRLCRRTL